MIKVAMAYGKFIPARKFSGTRKDGTKYSGESPAGYSGLFRANVTYANGKRVFAEDGDEVYSVSDYFFNRDESSWETVNDSMDKFYGAIVPRDGTYGCQYGFGGDEGDGLIDFFAKERIEVPKPMKFELFGTEYVMSWYYCGEDCPYDCACPGCKDPDSDHGEGCCCKDCTYRPQR
jgi:hypothetical protein